MQGLGGGACEEAVERGLRKGVILESYYVAYYNKRMRDDVMNSTTSVQSWSSCHACTL